MREFTEKIKLVKNIRGVWDLDPFKGCTEGTAGNKNGCYGLCYARNIANFRGYDFCKTVYRYFEDENQVKMIGKKIMQTSLLEGVQPEFVRLGVMCDPSHDWEHTLSIVDKIKKYNPNIVIITKHWNGLNQSQLERLKGICINTSISALDSEVQRGARLYWYNKLKKYCNSVLRVNTADFNDEKLKKIQNDLLKNDKVINNILRMPQNHYLVTSGIVNVKKVRFLESDVYASVSDDSVHFGYCYNCPEKCGINL